MNNIQNSIINTSRMVVSFEEKLLDIVSFLSELSYEWVLLHRYQKLSWSNQISSMKEMCTKRVQKSYHKDYFLATKQLSIFFNYTVYFWSPSLICVGVDFSAISITFEQNLVWKIITYTLIYDYIGYMLVSTGLIL